MKKTPDKSNDADPEGLWRKVARTVRPYAPGAAPGIKKTAAAPKPAPAVKKTAVARPSVKPATAPAAMDSSLSRRLKRGKEEIEATLDLHGMTQSEARAALGRFIAGAERRDRRMLLVITGKGRAEGSGVLKRMLPLWLEEFSSVLSFSPAHARDGGAGAFYVRLRKAKN